MILDGVPENKLYYETIEKLKKIYLMEDYNLLQRNLEVLIGNKNIADKFRKASNAIVRYSSYILIMPIIEKSKEHS